MPEIRGLTGLRGVAAILVVWFHMRDALEARGLLVDLPLLAARFIDGSKSVDVFFVLSGFIMALSYRKWFQQTVPANLYFSFLSRRFARIYPLHLFMLALVVALVATARVMNAATVNGLDRFDYAELIPYLLLIQAWGPFTQGVGEWNPPAWSISIEALAYLFFPFLMWLIVRFKGSGAWLLLSITIAIGFSLNAVTTWDMSGFGACARGLSEFALGCVTAQFYQSRLSTWFQSNLGSWVAMLGLIAAFALTPVSGFIIAVASAAALLALCGSNPSSRFFSWRPVYFLGEISYSIYLGHFIFMSICWRLVSVNWMRTSTLAAAAGILLVNLLIIGFATATYYGIERPGRDLLTGQRKRTTPTSATALG